MVLKKKILSLISAAAIAVTMTAAGGAVSAKDTVISGTYTQGTTLGTFSRATAWVMTPLS